MPPSARFHVVLITAPDSTSARQLARGLLQKRLAACVNVIAGVVSNYRWKGAIKKNRQSLLIVKTTRRKLAALICHVKANHPDEVPETIALDVVAGSSSYLDWLADSVK